MENARINETAARTHIRQVEQQMRMDALNLAHRMSGAGIASAKDIVSEAKKLLAFVKAK